VTNFEIRQAEGLFTAQLRLACCCVLAKMTLALLVLAPALSGATDYYGQLPAGSGVPGHPYVEIPVVSVDYCKSFIAATFVAKNGGLGQITDAGAPAVTRKVYGSSGAYADP
jgi:hypothetical protein